jgi:hypothetical protein
MHLTTSHTRKMGGTHRLDEGMNKLEDAKLVL